MKIIYLGRFLWNLQRSFVTTRQLAYKCPENQTIQRLMLRGYEWQVHCYRLTDGGSSKLSCAAGRAKPGGELVCAKVAEDQIRHTHVARDHRKQHRKPTPKWLVACSGMHWT
jgi:hypothetical protein